MPIEKANARGARSEPNDERLSRPAAACLPSLLPYLSLKLLNPRFGSCVAITVLNIVHHDGRLCAAVVHRRQAVIPAREQKQCLLSECSLVGKGSACRSILLTVPGRRCPRSRTSLSYHRCTAFASGRRHQSCSPDTRETVPLRSVTLTTTYRPPIRPTALA